MGRCINCKLEILDNAEICPLCSSVLLPTDEAEDAYPDVRPPVRNLTLKFNTYLFAASLFWAGAEIYNILMGLQHRWNIAAGAVLFYICVVWYQMVNGRTSYRNKVLAISFMSAVFLMGIDHSLGFDGWSVSWAIPIGLLLTVFMIVYCMLRDHHSWQSYMSGQLWTMLFSLLVWGICCWTEKEQYVAALVFLLSLILFSGTVTIGGHRARMELKRRFHTH